MDILNEIGQEPKLASTGRRMASGAIDIIIFWLIAYGIALATDSVVDTGNGFSFQLEGMPALLLFGIWILMVPVNEGLTGQTIGKRICAIKVVKTDYTPAGVGRSFLRHLLDGIDLCFFFIGLILIAAGSKKQRIGDAVAGTIVVYKQAHVL